MSTAKSAASQTASPPSRPRRGALRALGSLVLFIGFAAGLVFMMLVLSGWFEPKVSSHVAAVEATAKLPAGAETAEVKTITRPRSESAVGTIRAVYEVNVASKILARVESIKVKAGQTVEKGEVLAVLDDADLKARLEQAQAAVSAAEAKREQAQNDFDRARALRSRNSISQQEFDQAQTTLRAAAAELEQANQAVKEAQIVGDYAVVRAPIGGRVVDKRVNEGDTVTPGQTIVAMYDPEHMQMVATVRESLALRLEVGQELPARLDVMDLDCHATVTEIVPEAQAESRSFQVKVTGPCPPGLYSGMFGRIFIPLDEEKVFVVPPEAVRQVGQLDEVLVVEDGVVRRRAVQLGRSLPEGREVLSGLKAGERVVMQRPAAQPKGGEAPAPEGRS